MAPDMFCKSKYACACFNLATFAVIITRKVDFRLQIQSKSGTCNKTKQNNGVGAAQLRKTDTAMSEQCTKVLRNMA